MTQKRFHILPDTIVGRAIVILAGALIALHVLGFWAYRAGVESLATNARDSGLAERIVSIKRAIASTTNEDERDKAAHALATASLDVHWSKVSLVLGNAAPTERELAMEARLKELAPDIASESFRVGFADEGVPSVNSEKSRHLLLVSVRLDDGSWINFASPTFGTAHHLTGNILIFAAIIGLGIGSIAIFLLGRATRPFRDLALAAEKFSIDSEHPGVSEDGPAEVRRAAGAFNAMAKRIRKLVSERTQALAAVSHDLKTPITRLRLRSELLDDETTRELVDADLREMEVMIDSTLDFLRMGISNEETKSVDVAALVATIANEEADKGRSISLKGLNHATILGKPVSLKRAFSNVIGNAIKFAEVVMVRVEADGNFILIEVLDDGPGIAESEFEKVFDPFYRVESSRSRETGGTGLGLTITKAIVSEHGGQIRLANRKRGGLRVTIRLPLPAQ